MSDRVLAAVVARLNTADEAIVTKLGGSVRDVQTLVRMMCDLRDTVDEEALQLEADEPEEIDAQVTERILLTLLTALLCNNFGVCD
jgi:hypothetical protein